MGVTGSIFIAGGIGILNRLQIQSGHVFYYCLGCVFDDLVACLLVHDDNLRMRDEYTTPLQSDMEGMVGDVRSVTTYLRLLERKV